MGLLKRWFGRSWEESEERVREPEGFEDMKRKYGAVRASELWKKAEAGDSDACLAIAECFYERAENDLAFRWLHKAADEMKRPEAMVLLVDYYRGYFLGFDVDLEKADWYLKKALDMESPKAYLKMASDQYSKYDSTEQEIMFGYYLKAAKLGDTEWQALVGRAYLEGKGISQDYEEAFRWLSMSTDYKDAAYPLARCYLEGLGTKVNPEKAVEYLELAAGAHCLERDFAWEELLRLYEAGYGGEDKDKKAERVRAEEAKGSKLMSEIAASLYNGKSGNKRA